MSPKPNSGNGRFGWLRRNRVLVPIGKPRTRSQRIVKAAVYVHGMLAGLVPGSARFDRLAKARARLLAMIQQLEGGEG